jgi:branched-chain amino acid transport system permease protein
MTTMSANMPTGMQTINWGRWIIWGLFALMLLMLPRLFTSSLAVSLLSQMGIAIIACLSYNMLLGQGGMLSFGHAVYSGLGAYMTIHALNMMSSLAKAGGPFVPVSLLPIVGGLAGLFFAALFGFVTTKKAGTPFAMITLGMAELVFAMSLMFAEFFGGEAGVTGNRVVGRPALTGLFDKGISFGPGIQVYYLIAIYTFICVALMYAFTRTPLGRILNAVRDNPERVEFIGYSTQHVRYLAFMISGFFAGIAGGLGAILFEIVTAEVVGTLRSGGYLLFTFLGGATVFFGPIIGGVLLVLTSVMLSELTKAWLLYLGLIFLFMVMYAPGGVASLILMNLRVAKFGFWGRIASSTLYLVLSGAVALLGAAVLIEMIYHRQLNVTLGSEVVFLGLTLDVQRPGVWLGALVFTLVGFVLLELARRRYARQWGEVQSRIERIIKHREEL